MTIQLLAKKLRHAADVLDDLLVVDHAAAVHAASKAARKIRADLVAPKRAYTRRTPLKKAANTKGFRYHGKHWQQRPENRARVIRLAKQRAALRLKKAKREEAA